MLCVDGLVSECLHVIGECLLYLFRFVILDAYYIQRVIYQLFLDQPEEFAIVFYLPIYSSV